VAEFLQSAAARASGLVIEGRSRHREDHALVGGGGAGSRAGFRRRIGAGWPGRVGAGVCRRRRSSRQRGSRIVRGAPRRPASGRRPGALAVQQRRASDRSPCGRGGPGVIGRTARGAHSRVDRDRRRAMARPVQPGRHLVRGPPVRRPRRHPRHRTVRCRQWDLGLVAAPRQAGWPRPPYRQRAESRRASRADLGATRPNIRASDHGADCRDLRRKPLLCARTGACHRHGIRQRPLETARNTCRADAHAHQPARSRRQGPPPGCGIRRDADRGTARASRRHHVRASCRAAFGGTSQGHPRD